jgi:hypothetical protein
MIECDKNTAIVFIDDTGNEFLKDPNYPIFGLGGIIVLGKNYCKEIVEPWCELKEKEFESKCTPLHATDLVKPSQSQLNALNNFFSTKIFKRFACTLSNKTQLKNIRNNYTTIVDCVRGNINALLKLLSFDSLLFVIEESDSVDHDKYKSLHWLGERDEFINVNTEVIFKTKKDIEPGLEVADFVINAFGSTYKDKLAGKITSSNERPDYFNIIKSVSEKDISTIELSRIETVGYIPD